jgi:tetraacyldisaccharide 4'-kinase
MNSLFLYIKKIIEEDKKGFFIFFLKLFLFFLSFIFSFLVFLRNFLYDKKILKEKKINAKIISVGNITTGGSNKTPFAIFLLDNIKKKTAVVLRGYKSNIKTKSYLIKKSDTAEKIGDEAKLIKNNKDVDIFIGSNKKLSCINASKNNEVIILDDGFQSRYLKRDLNILLINYEDIFKKKYLLPRGLFRENFKALKRANIIIINYLKDEKKLPLIKKVISKYSKAKIYQSSLEVVGFYDINNCKVSLKSNKIAAFSSIANPKYFFSTLEKLKLNILLKKEKLDHEKFSKEELNAFIQKAMHLEVDYVITTEKDIIKLNKDDKFNLPIIYIKTKIILINNYFDINEILENN